MRALILALSITGAMTAASWTMAAEAQTDTLTPQQERMKTCNTQATTQNLKGQTRQDFMSDCLSGQSSTGSGTSQQERMTACNRAASSQGLAGNARQAFMSDCLKRQ